MSMETIKADDLLRLELDAHPKLPSGVRFAMAKAADEIERLEKRCDDLVDRKNF